MSINKLLATRNKVSGKFKHITVFSFETRSTTFKFENCQYYATVNRTCKCIGVVTQCEHMDTKIMLSLVFVLAV